MKPEDLLKRVRQELEAAFPAKQAKLQNRSVNIEFQGTGISFDVVPALEDPSRPGEYQIPDRSRDTWIRSNPRRHRQAFAAANEATRTKLHPLIKMLKRWNAVVGKPVPSFLLEVMAYSAATTLPPASSYAEGMVHLFQFIQEHIEESWPDPAGLGPPVNANVGAGHLQQAQQRATETLRKARRALEEEQNRNHAAAIELWRAVLGLDFPGS